jgi:hypothetical protein
MAARHQPRGSTLKRFFGDPLELGLKALWPLAKRLTWVSQNFIRPETLAAASARIVSAHAALPLVKLWGAGDFASADGMRFTAPASAIHAGPNPKYFGQARGVTWYNLLSNQFSGLNGIVVPGTLRDSLVLLVLLLEQETELEPMEFMTDTAAYSDAVFGLFWLLGYQFSPRLADLGDARLWRIDRKADYGPFNGLSKGTINLALIRENWPDVIRLAGSLKLGHLKAAGIMRTLQVRGKTPRPADSGPHDIKGGCASMAEIIYPVGTACQINQPNHIETDEDVGISFKPKSPSPDSLQQRESMVIEVEMFNLDGPDVYRKTLSITMVQAGEIGRWLTKRAQEAKRADQWKRVRNLLHLAR